MAGLARLLWQGGATVSGSDLRASPKLHEVEEWAEVHLGHSPDFLPLSVDALVFSSAVSSDNPEIRAAQGALPIYPRLYALRSLLAGRELLAVVGTHGKTTTTTWITHLLRSLGLEPGHYVGGKVPGLPLASWGKGPLFVAEVDESDGRFVWLRPKVTVLTSVDSDHLGTYHGFAGLKRAFSQFLARSQKIAVCFDDPVALSLARDAGVPFTFGVGDGADLQAKGMEFHRERSGFELWCGGRPWGWVEVPGPGIHNVRNALAALAAGVLLDLPLGDLVDSLARAPRPRRRLEVLEENGYLVVDDYAHHPTEIAAGISALRQGWPKRRVIAVVQPHRYTRTAALCGPFGQVLAKADYVVVTEIFPAFERPIPGVSGRDVAGSILAAGGQAVFRRELPKAMEAAAEVIRPGDVVVCFGAGDIWWLAREMARSLSSGS